MFQIGEFSRLNKITVRTLRYYDEVDLLKPYFIDEESGYRYYDADQISVLSSILLYRRLGFSISEIKGLIKNTENRERMIRYFEKKQELINDEISELQKTEKELEKNLMRLKNGGKIMENNIVIKELKEVFVASMRKKIKNYGDLNKIYPEMGELMRAEKLTCAKPSYCFTLYHDKEYKESDIDIEICEAITELKEDKGELKYKKIDRVETAATLFHKGPYEILPELYSQVGDWIEKNGYEIIGLARESYINGIWNEKNPDNWLTEIQIPVKYKGK